MGHRNGVPMSKAEAPAGGPRGGLALELGALAAQCLFFLVGMALSIVIGMLLGKVLHGPGGLLIATLVAGTGLLVAAALSQTLHDWMIQRSLDRSA